MAVVAAALMAKGADFMAQQTNLHPLLAGWLWMAKHPISAHLTGDGAVNSEGRLLQLTNIFRLERIGFLRFCSNISQTATQRSGCSAQHTWQVNLLKWNLSDRRAALRATGKVLRMVGYGVRSHQLNFDGFGMF